MSSSPRYRATLDPDAVDKVPDVNLTQFVMGRSGDAELAMMMNAMAMACKGISRAVRKAGIAGLFGLDGSSNSSGDDVKKLDVLSNEIMVSALLDSHCCAVLVSEENEEPIIVEPAKAGRLCVAFDPLDGSSNIDCNVSTGTIFGVWERLSEKGNAPATVADILRPGSEQICAGYCMYGSATELVLTGKSDSVFGRGTHRFVLDPSFGEFIYIGPLAVPADGGKRIYSCNEGNMTSWDGPIKKAVDGFKGLGGDKPYTARYVGSMVSDVHRTLLYGGIFLYPADKKSPKGKLRMLYEGYPMALITEQAGGCASTGMFEGQVRRILDVPPQGIHDRCPIVMGVRRDVDAVLRRYDTAEGEGEQQPTGDRDSKRAKLA